MQSIIIYFVQLNEMVELQKEVDKISTEIEELYQKHWEKTTVILAGITNYNYSILKLSQCYYSVV